MRKLLVLILVLAMASVAGARIEFRASRTEVVPGDVITISLVATEGEQVTGLSIDAITDNGAGGTVVDGSIVLNASFNASAYAGTIVNSGGILIEYVSCFAGAGTYATGLLYGFDYQVPSLPAGSLIEIGTYSDDDMYLQPTISFLDGSDYEEPIVAAYVWVDSPVICTVPNCVGLTTTECCQTLMAEGFICGTETGVFSDTVPINHVTAQNPAPGTITTCGSPVNLSYVCRTVHCLNPYCRGDVNKDKWVRSNDISALVALVTSYGPVTYRAQNTTCRYNPCADIDGDYWVRSSDISALVAMISGYPAPTYRCSCGTANCPYYTP